MSEPKMNAQASTNAEAESQPQEPLPCPFCGTAVLAEEDADDLEADEHGITVEP